MQDLAGMGKWSVPWRWISHFTGNVPYVIWWGGFALCDHVIAVPAEEGTRRLKKLPTLAIGDLVQERRRLSATS